MLYDHIWAHITLKKFNYLYVWVNWNIFRWITDQLSQVCQQQLNEQSKYPLSNHHQLSSVGELTTKSSNLNKENTSYSNVNEYSNQRYHHNGSMPSSSVAASGGTNSYFCGGEQYYFGSDPTQNNQNSNVSTNNNNNNNYVNSYDYQNYQQLKLQTYQTNSSNINANQGYQMPHYQNGYTNNNSSNNGNHHHYHHGHNQFPSHNQNNQGALASSVSSAPSSSSACFNNSCYQSNFMGNNSFLEKYYAQKPSRSKCY